METKPKKWINGHLGTREEEPARQPKKKKKKKKAKVVNYPMWSIRAAAAEN